MASIIEEIKEKIDIVDFLRGYLEIKPAGKNFKALCPFHQEKTPSFIISPDRQIWHCFGVCSEGGDVFKFLMKHENIEFHEALKTLAEKAGIDLKRLSPADQREFGVLYDLHRAASDFFRAQLEKSKVAKEYLFSRSLKKEIIDEFALGFSPNNFEDLTVHLINLGFDIKDIARAGLAIKSEKGRYFDRFRGRIIFPLLNNLGKTVGFSGRILPALENQETAKYLNSPETPIFSKSRILFGIYQAKKSINENKFVLLVEGYMDVILAHQDGVKNSVGTSGTALTRDHLKILKRHTNNLILCFDNDLAGQQTTERSIDLAHENDFDIKILDLNRFSSKENFYKDPGDLVKASPGLLKNLVLKAETSMNYYLSRYLGEENFSNKKQNLRFVLGKAKTLASSLDRHYWISEISERTKIREKDLLEEIEKLPVVSSLSFSRIQSPVEEVCKKASRKELISERFLAIVNFREELKPKFEELMVSGQLKDYLPLKYFEIAECLISGEAPKNEETANFYDLICLESSLVDGDKLKIEEEFNDLVRCLQIEFLSEKKENLADLIKKTEKSEDDSIEGLKEYLKEFQIIAKKIDELKIKPKT